jgi:hypothetical protein
VAAELLLSAVRATDRAPCARSAAPGAFPYSAAAQPGGAGS